MTSSETKLRVLIAERRASAHSELSRRLDRAGHEVLARVTSGQGALDYAELLRPDAVLIAPTLEDGPGIMAAIALTRELPGVAAVVLTAHPAALNPAARPNWGAVALVPADAEAADLDTELRRAVTQAREAAATAVVPEPMVGAQAGPADFAPAATPTLQYQTPNPEGAQAIDSMSATKQVASTIAAARTVAASPGPVLLAPTPVVAAHAGPVTPKPDMKPASPSQSGRSPLSFTDEDLIAIGPIADLEVSRARPTVAQSSPITSAALSPAPITPVLPAVTSAAPTGPVLVESQAPYDGDMSVIAEAAECLLERTGLSRSDAMRLMEQEAADTGRKLVEVAQSVLGRDGEASGSEIALAS